MLKWNLSKIKEKRVYATAEITIMLFANSHQEMLIAGEQETLAPFLCPLCQEEA